MGWLFMPRGSMGGHATAKAYLDNQFTYERVQDDGSSEGLKVLASSCPGNRVYYAATQVMTNGRGGEIFAIVCLVRWNPRAKDGYIFGYKDMDESMGPCETDCPASILDLLTPTDKEVSVRARGVISGVGDGVFRGGACPTPECGVAGGHRVHRYGGVCTLQP